jgi:hypothetical protein
MEAKSPPPRPASLYSLLYAVWTRLGQCFLFFLREHPLRETNIHEHFFSLNQQFCPISFKYSKPLSRGQLHSAPLCGHTNAQCSCLLKWDEQRRSEHHQWKRHLLSVNKQRLCEQERTSLSHI